MQQKKETKRPFSLSVGIVLMVGGIVSALSLTWLFEIEAPTLKEQLVKIQAAQAGEGQK